MTGDFSALLLAIFLALGMAFMAASFITFVVQERVSKVITYAYAYISMHFEMSK